MTLKENASEFSERAAEHIYRFIYAENAFLETMSGKKITTHSAYLGKK